MHFLKYLSLAAEAALFSATAHGATLCVNTFGIGHCYTTISDAVAAASPNDLILVGPGTYKEYVIITKPLSLTGIQATINAEGLSRGIFVNGMAAPNLSEVHISGFTVKKANFEGILIANASAVSVSNNTVINNNQALTNGTCPGIEGFEPGEQMDCGEGIHLLGADHSIVTGNTVHGNSGGILISDDTGANHDNLISFNQVSDNPFACGIVLASHPAAPNVPSGISPGVFHNTVYGNHSEHNGFSGDGGAGVGIFAAVPGAANYGNVIVNNYINNNGHPGISLHAHVPGQKVTDNMLVGNTIVNNGADTGDAATPGPTGINIYSAGTNPGNIISANSIQRETDDVAVNNPSLLVVGFNNLQGNNTGVDNIGTGAVDATWNWWNCLAGPRSGGNCSSANGPNILTTPWLLFPATIQQN
jgi:parallel beta-helix repeat protein